MPGRYLQFPDPAHPARPHARREPLRLPPAFFTLNGLVGLGLALATWMALSI